MQRQKITHILQMRTKRRNMSGGWIEERKMTYFLQVRMKKAYEWRAEEAKENHAQTARK